MERVNLGTTSIETSRMGMSLWRLGRGMWATTRDEEVVATLRGAYEEGVTLFDTEEPYGDGYSEKMLCAAFGSMRDRVIYAGKVFISSQQSSDIREGCERTLRNLSTDYLDLYQIHWAQTHTGAKPNSLALTIETLLELKRGGKIRAIGLSNCSTLDFEQSLMLTDIASIQTPYSLFDHSAERELIQMCSQHKVTILGSAPLAHGLLAGTYGAKTKAVNNHLARLRLFRGLAFEVAIHEAERLSPYAAAHTASVAQIALAYLLHDLPYGSSEPPQVVPLWGARNEAQARQNCRSEEIRLSDEEYTEIKAIGDKVWSTVEKSL